MSELCLRLSQPARKPRPHIVGRLSDGGLYPVTHKAHLKQAVIVVGNTVILEAEGLGVDLLTHDLSDRSRALAKRFHGPRPKVGGIGNASILACSRPLRQPEKLSGFLSLTGGVRSTYSRPPNSRARPAKLLERRAMPNVLGEWQPRGHRNPSWRNGVICIKEPLQRGSLE